MKYVLDTHVWIWGLDSAERLPARVRQLLLEPANLPFGLSAISPWEALKKESLGRLKLSCPGRVWVTRAVRDPFVALLPLGLDVSYEANHLPGSFHRDPADQIIVATARLHDLTLITCDRRILDYGQVRTLWA